MNASCLHVLDDINDCVVAPGSYALWWLGQMGFVVKLGTTIVYLDAFLSPHQRRQVLPLMAPDEVTNAAIVCGTHDHSDHIDRPAWQVIAPASPDAVFVVPALLLPRVADELGIPLARMRGVNANASIELSNVRITGIPSAHEFLDQDPVSGLFPYMGYVIEGNGCTLYHAGDCCVYEGLLTALRAYRLDVMFLPINGRDAVRYARNCMGNMTYQEAVDLAGMLGPGLVIPGHFDMFAANGENPELFAAYLKAKYPRVRTLIPRHGARINGRC